MKDMKKIILTIAAAAAMIPAFAGGHLSFKGVEIKGTKEEMVIALGKKGFRFEENNNGTPLVIGNFAGSLFMWAISRDIKPREAEKE